MDGNRVGVGLVSTVTVDGEVPGMKVERKQTSPLRWQQHSNWFAFPARTGRKKKHNKVPQQPRRHSSMLHQKSKRQGKKMNTRSQTCALNLYTHTHTLLSHIITCSTSPCSCPSRYFSPTLPPKHLQHVKPAQKPRRNFRLALIG